MEDMENKIILTALTDTQIKEKGLTQSHLWLVRLNDRTYGPFDTKSLKEYAQLNQQLLEHAEGYNMATESWCDFFSISQFQRRKPQLVAEQNLIKTNYYHVQIDSETHGPLTKNQINALLDNGRIQPYSLLSIDEGKNWAKAFQFHIFDRRNTHSDTDLPFMPKDVEQEQFTVNDITSEKKEEIVFALADMNSEKQTNIQIIPEQTVDTDDKSTSFFKNISAGLAIVLTLGIGLVSYTSRNPKSALTSKPSRSSVESINNSDRSIRKPASVANKTRSFQPRKKMVEQTMATGAYESMASRSRRNKQKIERILEEHDDDFLDDDTEEIDINDPEVQAELTRQLAGEYELDGDEYDEDDAQLDDDGDQYIDDSLGFD